MKFLPIDVPFHSDYLKNCAAAVISSLEEDYWKAEDIKIPVYHTATGN
jgi:fatty acid synthase subunit beta